MVKRTYQPKVRRRKEDTVFGNGQTPSGRNVLREGAKRAEKVLSA